MRPVSPRELLISLYGAWRFARFDRRAQGLFDNSEDAFWKSFSAALVAAPFYIVLISYSSPAIPGMGVRFVAIEAVTYAIGWLLFPFVMIAVVDALGRANFYWRFIAAWNWSIVLQVVLFCCVAVTTSGQNGPSGLGAIITVLATFFIFFYQGFIARVMLDIRVVQAAVIVLFDVGLALGLRALSGWLHQG